MKKIWVSDYKRIAMATYAEHSAYVRDSLMIIVDQYMAKPTSKFYKFESPDGVLIGFFIVDNGIANMSAIRNHLGLYFNTPEMLKLISDAEKGM
jgi:hypothetical protein